MENGPNAKHGEKWGKRGRFAPIKNGEKMAEKYRKNGKSGQLSCFRPFFGHFFPIFDRGEFSTFFFPSFFPILGVRPVFVFHCVPAPHDCNSKPLAASLLILKVPKMRMLGQSVIEQRDHESRVQFPENLGLI